MGSDARGAGFSARSILVAEDNDNLRSSLCEFLGFAFPGYCLLEAGDGRQAVEIASTHSLDIVIMDIEMPRLNGIDATKMIKEFKPKLPILMLTVHENPEYAEEAEKVGANGYILKRDMHKELISFVRNILDINLN